MFLRQIFDPHLAQYAYLVGCQKTGEAIIFDPERDIEQYKKLAKENNLKIVAVAETHIHADFVSGAQEFAADPNIKVYLSAEGGKDWSYNWPQNRPNTFYLKNLADFNVGNIKITAVHTPGHTPEHLSFLITDVGGGADEPMHFISGDFLFVGDVGRPDLLESAAGIKNVMEPSARLLQQSLATVFNSHPDYLQILPAHGAGSACGKSLGAVPSSTLGYEKKFNSAFKLALSDAENFVKEILKDQPEPPLYFARMKKVNRDGIKVTGSLPKVKNLSLAEFTELTKKLTTRVIDTRSSRQKFMEAHYANALYAPLHTSMFSNAVGSLVTAEESLILILENEADLELATKQLYRIGFDNLLGYVSLKDIEKAALLSDHIEQLNFATLKQLNLADTTTIVDVRSAAEYNKNHWPNAQLAPYTRLHLLKDTLPRNNKLYVHCGTGLRAAIASSYLKAAGFKIVFVDGAFSLS